MGEEVNPRFADPATRDRLEEAIRLGFIIRSESEGQITYTLTPSGLNQWNMEKLFGIMNR